MTQERFPLRRLALGGVVVGCLIAPLAAVARNPVSPLAAPAAQPPAAGRGGAQGPTVTSPEVRPDRRVTFRILAPDAQTVELRSPGDIPGVGGRGVAPPQLTKGADGAMWASAEDSRAHGKILRINPDGFSLRPAQTELVGKRSARFKVWIRVLRTLR